MLLVCFCTILPSKFSPPLPPLSQIVLALLLPRFSSSPKSFSLSQMRERKFSGGREREREREKEAGGRRRKATDAESRILANERGRRGFKDTHPRPQSHPVRYSERWVEEGRLSLSLSTKELWRQEEDRQELFFSSFSTTPVLRWRKLASQRRKAQFLIL